MTETAASSLDDGIAIPSQDYNRVFAKFVGEDPDGMSDIVGIVAYGIYKNAKREWATEFRSSYGRAPTADDLRAYHATWTPAQIQSARNSAAQVMTEYADAVISSEEPRILREAVKGTFWPSVWTSIAANAIYTIGLITVAVILARAGIDLLGLVSTAASK
jgi:hypothetical protein